VGEGVAEGDAEGDELEAGVGEGVVSAWVIDALLERIKAASEIPTVLTKAEPLDFTLSSIRRKSLYR
jgi:hypothetical protein